MSATTNFLAVDLGASNGRVLLARWDGERFDLRELHRFDNGPTEVHGRLYWDALRLWTEIQTGMARYAAAYSDPPAGIGVDTWGVDFGLLDSAGRLLGNPVHYRDDRTNGMPEAVFHVAPSETVFDITGIQFMQLNTIFQLYSMRYTGDPLLDFADTMLMMPDLFHYWLTGRKVAEYTIASTSQLFHARDRRWATGLMAQLDLPTRILPEVVPPGTVLGNVLPDVLEAAGLRGDVPVIAPGSHDTASAVAAVPGLDAQSLYISSGTWSLMGVEIDEPIISERTRELNFTNEGGVDDTIRLLKNIGGLWLLQESRRQWQREGADYSWDDLTAHAQEAEPFRTFANPDAAEFLNPANMVDAIRNYAAHHEPAGAGICRPDSPLLSGRIGPALSLGTRRAGGTHRRAAGDHAHRGRRQPEPHAQPARCGRLPAPRRHRPRGGHRAGQRHGAGHRRRPSLQRSRGPRSHRRQHPARDL